MPKYVQKCWEYMHCHMQEICTAHPDNGFECWAIAGTKRNLKVDKTPEQQQKELKERIAGGFTKKRCKYISRYVMCSCCPYYLYAENMKQEIKILKGPME